MPIVQNPVHATRISQKCISLINFAETCKARNQAPAQPERKTPDEATYVDGALIGRGQSGRRRRRLHHGGPRLSREKQGREALHSFAQLCNLNILSKNCRKRRRCAPPQTLQVRPRGFSAVSKPKLGTKYTFFSMFEICEVYKRLDRSEFKKSA